MGLKKYDAEAKKAEELKKTEALNATKSTEVEEPSEEPKSDEEEKELPVELTDYEKEVSSKVNKRKDEYANFIKKQKRINALVSVIALILGVGGMVLVFVRDKLGVNGLGGGLGTALFFVAFIEMFVSGRILKKQREAEALDYVDVLFEETNKYIYSATEFSNLSIQPRYQIESTRFTDAKLYKDIKATRSRNYCEVTYKDKLLCSCDMAANILIKNRTSPMFLGKFYEYPCDYNEEGKRILFQLKGKELSRPLDDIEGLELVDGNKKYNVYSNDEQWKKVFGDRVLRELLSFKIDSTLIDVIVSIGNGKVCLGIDYADSFMDIPVTSEFNFETYRRAKKDLEKVISVFDLLNK